MQIKTIGMRHTQKQIEFLKLAESGQNIFLSGKAGTGKSTILKEFMNQTKKKVVCCAPTGIAAINVGGSTIHSLFSIKMAGIGTYKNASYLKPIKREVLEKAEIIVIDEVSMLRCDILDAMNYTLNRNHIGSLKDKQIIFVGDMKQLPVVVDKNTESVLYSEGYKGVTFKDALIFNKLNVQEIELDEVVRQNDEEFVSNLNIIRDGGKSDYFKKFVSTKPKGIILAPHNATVQSYNENGLKTIEGTTYLYEAKYDGLVNENDFSFEKLIRVKNGAPIMYLKNEDSNSLLRNGTIGTFYYSHEKDKMFINVQGIKYEIKKAKASKNEYVYDEDQGEIVLKEVGNCEQYPFKLAFALSIHKSQGLTFDEVTIDLNKPCFMPGQMYVALSRVRTPQGLRIVVNR